MRKLSYSYFDVLRVSPQATANSYFSISSLLQSTFHVPPERKESCLGNMNQVVFIFITSARVYLELSGHLILHNLLYKNLPDVALAGAYGLILESCSHVPNFAATTEDLQNLTLLTLLHASWLLELQPFSWSPTLSRTSNQYLFSMWKHHWYLTHLQRGVIALCFHHVQHPFCCSIQKIRDSQ